MIIHIVPVSGGKDSQATVIWAKRHLTGIILYVFCDTDWEKDVTYQHLLYLQEVNKIEIIVLTSKKYYGMIDLVRKKGRFPSTMSRFCTEKLKFEPMLDYILSLSSNVVIYQGVRADESKQRALMNKVDNYFRYYFEPYGVDKKGKPKFQKYRKLEVKYHSEIYTTTVIRPVFDWTAKEVISYCLEAGQRINPLYYKGYSRVGCYPCIMCQLGEVLLISQQDPDRLLEIAEYEKENDTTFFPMDYIPERYCSKPVFRKDGTPGKAPVMEDVVKYVQMKNPPTLWGIPQCQSVYHICE